RNTLGCGRRPELKCGRELFLEQQRELVRSAARRLRETGALSERDIGRAGARSEIALASDEEIQTLLDETDYLGRVIDRHRRAAAGADQGLHLARRTAGARRNRIGVDANVRDAENAMGRARRIYRNADKLHLVRRHEEALEHVGTAGSAAVRLGADDS